MSLSLENANLVRQKAKIALLNAHPVAQDAFEALQKYLASQGGNPDLQFIAIDGTDADGASGTVSADAACQVYGFYGKKVDAAEDAYFELFDDATNDATAGDARVALPFLIAEEEAFAIFPQGLPMAAGVVAKLYTTLAGTTDTTAGSGANGFVIIGAA
jgi:hypothetical protein